MLCCISEVISVWQAREVGELRKRGRLLEIRRCRKHARRRRSAKLLIPRIIRNAVKMIIGNMNHMTNKQHIR